MRCGDGGCGLLDFFNAAKLLMPMTFAAKMFDAVKLLMDLLTARKLLIFFNAAKLDFVARRKLILLVDFRRRKVDVRGEETFVRGTFGAKILDTL